jgi:hypothetical protein
MMVKQIEEGSLAVQHAVHSNPHSSSVAQGIEGLGDDELSSVFSNLDTLTQTSPGPTSREIPVTQSSPAHGNDQGRQPASLRMLAAKLRQSEDQAPVR